MTPGRDQCLSKAPPPEPLHLSPGGSGPPPPSPSSPPSPGHPLSHVPLFPQRPEQPLLWCNILSESSQRTHRPKSGSGSLAQSSVSHSPGKTRALQRAHPSRGAPVATTSLSLRPQTGCPARATATQPLLPAPGPPPIGLQSRVRAGTWVSWALPPSQAHTNTCRSKGRPA